MGASIAAVVALAAAAVSVRTNKGIVVPGADASAELLVVARDAPPDARVELAATCGKVGAVRPLGDGRYQATFVPPQDAPPAVAFITARVVSGEQVELGLAAIAVHGATTVEADAAPRSKVTIDAGGRAFGPFTADGGGRVRARILVPPRLKEVTLRADAGERAVPLELPPVSLVYVAGVAAGEASHAAGEAPLMVEILSVDRNGYPAWKPPARLVADRGEVASLGPVAPGVFRWKYEAPVEASGGEARLTANIPGDPASVASLVVKLRPALPEAAAAAAAERSRSEPAPPPSLELRMSDRRVVAGEGNEIGVEVVLGGRVATPAELASAAIEADVGTLIPAAGGVRWVFPDSFGGRRGAELRVSAGGSAAVERVALVPGPPAVGRIAFDAPQARGGRPLGARLTLTDAHHNAVSGARLTVRASRGEASAATEEPAGSGVYRFTYTPPDVSAPETERFEVAEAGGLVVPAPPLPVTPRLAGLGVSAGLVVGGHSNLALAVGGAPAVELDVRLPSTPVVEVVLRADRAFYRLAELPLSEPGTSQVARFGGFGGEAGVRVGLQLRPWLAAHVTFSELGRLVETTLAVRGGPANGQVEVSSAFCYGPSVGVGLSAQVGLGRFLLEGGYALLPGQGALRGNLAGWGVRAGFLWELL